MFICEVYNRVIVKLHTQQEKREKIKRYNLLSKYINKVYKMVSHTVILPNLHKKKIKILLTINHLLKKLVKLLGSICFDNIAVSHTIILPNLTQINFFEGLYFGLEAFS